MASRFREEDSFKFETVQYGQFDYNKQIEYTFDLEVLDMLTYSSIDHCETEFKFYVMNPFSYDWVSWDNFLYDLRGQVSDHSFNSTASMEGDTLKLKISAYDL